MWALSALHSLQAYEELVKFHPEVDSYKIYYAQCLYKAGLYPEASRACLRVDSDQYAQRLLMLQVGWRMAIAGLLVD